MTNDVDTLATALYATTDDMLKEHPDLAPWRPPAGITPRLSDAELVTLATMQAILGYTRPNGSAMPVPTCATSSPTCPSSPATTSGYARPPV
ncbi:hypothetical protein HEK616_83080 (plasmid) [Streptomyces nigrescens]|uniref:Uncharacterized protein n=1 Tax=Streptomyces nigrescens TaxID=1920 RepID=A0ABM8A8G6_STRNI|nr:hypothetical protein HEK616_83080 [Streptomyces nigrescens]